MEPIIIKVSTAGIVEVTWDMNGKMLGLCSISTSVLTNPWCQRNSKIPGSICAQCYSHSMAGQYKDLDAKNQRNTDLLTSRVLEDDELPTIDPVKYPWCRLEAFGDLHNETQLQNYMNIVRKNSGSKWALYSKRYDLVYDYFTTHDVPENLTLVISSLMVNVKMDINKFKALGKFRKGQLKVFTVYNKEYIYKHPGLNINCGARSCFKCNRCYNQCPKEEVSEILKSDKEAVEKLMKLRKKLKDGDLGDFLD